MMDNNSSSNPKDGGPKSKKREITAYKYSKKGDDVLYEAVTLSDLPVFLKYEAGEVRIVGQIEEAGRIIKPPGPEEYPYEPYEFRDEKEIRSYVERTKTECIDSLYNKAKNITANYNDQDYHKLVLLAAIKVWSYFQDGFSTTHYLAVIGDNGSGKSTVGDTFEAVGYRVVNMTDPTAANLFRVLGTLEAGQCTIVADEAEKIDQSSEIMSTLKTGYQIKGKVARVNMNSGKQEFFFTYCFKMIIAERSPNEKKAKGVLDRTFVLNTYRGRPKYDIKEVLKPAGNNTRQTLLDELIDFRKLMLIYRLIHYRDRIEDIDIGVEGREKELCKPYLQLFHNSESYNEIRDAFQQFLDSKNQRKGNSLEAALHPLIVNLVSTIGNDVYVGQIWDLILETIPGVADEKKPNEFQTYDYDTLYRNTITSLICDKFGAQRRHRKNGTLLTFDPQKLVKVGNLYNLETKIQTKIQEAESNEDRKTDAHILQASRHGEGGEGGEGFEKRYASAKQNVLANEETASMVAAETSLNANSNSGSSSLLDCFWTDKRHHSPVQPSPSVPNSNIMLGPAVAATTAGRIYRIHPHSDIFACENCNRRGDKWDMKVHNCRGTKR